MKTKTRFNTKWLEDYMKKNNLTKIKLAEAHNLTIYQLNGFLNQRNVVSTTLYKICKYTKISPDKLLNR